MERTTALLTADRAPGPIYLAVAGLHSAQLALLVQGRPEALAAGAGYHLLFAACSGALGGLVLARWSWVPLIAPFVLLLDLTGALVDGATGLPPAAAGYVTGAQVLVMALQVVAIGLLWRPAVRRARPEVER
jgi:hypothetical protein